MRGFEYAEQQLRAGDLPAALEALQEAVRQRSDDAGLRVFLFQLLSLCGHWERAMVQLACAADLDASAADLADTYAEAIRCEIVREHVFAGSQAVSPPAGAPAWFAALADAVRLEADGQRADAGRLRQQAFEAAPASAGSLDGRRFTWIADADSRLGPVLEAIVDRRYQWIPWSDIRSLVLARPTDLRDLIWLPAHLSLASGHDAAVLLPARYPGSARADDASVVLGRKTTWDEVSADTYRGLGQRMLVTDADEVPMLEVRRIEIDGAADTDTRAIAGDACA